MSLRIRGLIDWAVLALAAAFALSGPAAANPFSLTAATCTGGAASAEAAFAIPPSRLDCAGERFSRRDPFQRAHIDLAKLGPVPPGRLIWETDPASFEAMLIRVTYRDGSSRLIDVDAQMAVRNWDANGNFWVPIQQDTSPLAAIDVVVERPQASAVLRGMTLGSAAASADAKYARTLFYLLLCGILLVPILYDLLFYRVLRARFMIWHVVMTAGTLAYTLFNSGLVMLLWRDIPSFMRFAGVFLAISLSIVGSARFSVLVMEEGKVAASARNALTAAIAANCALAFLILLKVEAWRMWIVDLYFFSVLPVLAASGWVLGAGLLRGSRAARILVGAYAPVALVGAAQVLALLGVLPRSDIVDEAIYVGLVILVLGASAAVGDRFLTIKAERDQAQLTARKLTAMANSDGLTGLLNRRAFDLHRRLGKRQALLVADLDRFKQVNDTYGHQRGDAVLCHAARVIEEVVGARREGQVYRLGGEEFAVLCPVKDVDDMRALAEGIREAVESSGHRRDGFDMPDITISIGAVMGKGQLMHVAFADADGALYRAKEDGRNRFVVASDEPELA